MGTRPETHLIIVPGHGVCKKGCTDPDKVSEDASWVGGFPGEGRFYVEHAKRGVELAAQGASALLVFSGGQTRERAGRRSEAESYREIAADHAWWGTPAVRDRAITEDFARDSFENLLYGLAAFHGATGRWPAMVTVCGWGFKAHRYGLHRQALKWPEGKFVYDAVNNPEAAGAEKAVAGEKAKADVVARDLFLLGAEWVAQRELRNPFHRRHPYRAAAPALAPLFDFLDRHTYTDPLPWVEE